MSSCIKDLFVYELVKKYCRCKNILLNLIIIKIIKEKTVYIINVRFVGKNII